jgi:hypothetical protein
MLTPDLAPAPAVCRRPRGAGERRYVSLDILLRRCSAGGRAPRNAVSGSSPPVSAGTQGAGASAPASAWHPCRRLKLATGSAMAAAIRPACSAFLCSQSAAAAISCSRRRLTLCRVAPQRRQRWRAVRRLRVRDPDALGELFRAARVDQRLRPGAPGGTADPDLPAGKAPPELVELLAVSFGVPRAHGHKTRSPRLRCTCYGVSGYGQDKPERCSKPASPSSRASTFGTAEGLIAGGAVCSLKPLTRSFGPKALGYRHAEFASSGLDSVRVAGWCRRIGCRGRESAR